MIKLFLLLLILPQSLFALTLREIRTEVRTLMTVKGEMGTNLYNNYLTSIINEGQRQAVIENRPIIKSSQTLLSVGTTFYVLPSDFLQMSRVSLNYDVLDEVTPEALDKTDGWQETGSLPTHYFINFATRTKIGMYPFPSSSSSTGTLRYDYFAMAQDLSADADVPFNGITEMAPYHYMLVYFTAARVAIMDGRDGLATYFLTEYRAGMERMKNEAKSRPSYRPGASARRE